MDDKKKEKEKRMKELRGFVTALIKTATTYGCIQRTVDLQRHCTRSSSIYTYHNIYLFLRDIYTHTYYMYMYIHYIRQHII